MTQTSFLKEPTGVMTPESRELTVHDDEEESHVRRPSIRQHGLSLLDTKVPPVPAL